VSKSRAFSLIELVCVIATIAVVSAIVLPHWAAAMQDQQLNLAVRRITADLALAQSRANYGSASVTVAFNPNANSYQIVGLPDPDRPAQTYTVNLGADPYRVTLSSANFAGSTNLAFDGYGTPLAGGTLVLSLGGATRTLTVEATSGRVTN
jgi:prepilin-type N-terminal cleavage/methylation domain-containing protein